jgi:predicted HicB family RNase H-like nuclease
VKRLSFDVHPSLHQALKLRALQENRTMAEFLIQLLSEHVSSVSPLRVR